MSTQPTTEESVPTLRKFGRALVNSSKATGKALIDTDLRDIGHGTAVVVTAPVHGVKGRLAQRKLLKENQKAFADFVANRNGLVIDTTAR